MKQARHFFSATSLAVCFLITNSCSQTTIISSPNVSAVFVASTPCDEVSKTMFGIPNATKCELMKWNLTLFEDPKTSAPSDFKLICMYGMPKQGTKDFMKGAGTMVLEGKWTVGRGTRENAEAEVYRLDAGNSPVSLLFLKPGQNLLHLLDGEKRLMIGNGAWSYTLNRINPVDAPPGKFTPVPVTLQRIISDSSIVGIFDGRTSCNTLMRELNGISAKGCELTKWRLTLYQDPATHTPTTFQVQSVYVGKGDSLYTNKGKWVVAKGSKTDAGAVVYQLGLNPGKPQGTLAFLKADNNILFFLDENGNLLVGNIDFSFTLNNIRKISK